MGRRDPLLYSRKHRDHNRAYWQRLRLPCARCGKPIDYTGPQYLPNGRPNPRYLVVGHIVGRAEALALGWTAAQINDLSNTRPECTAFSVRSGGEEGVRMRRARQGQETCTALRTGSQQLVKRGCMPQRAIAEVLGVSRRTVERDQNELSQMTQLNRPEKVNWPKSAT